MAEAFKTDAASAGNYQMIMKRNAHQRHAFKCLLASSIGVARLPESGEDFVISKQITQMDNKSVYRKFF